MGCCKHGNMPSVLTKDEELLETILKKGLCSVKGKKKKEKCGTVTLHRGAFG
jgi:hypothetical protein